ncbi:MAG: hypothetical protein WCP95_04435 [Actinomycetes bacterium]
MARTLVVAGPLALLGAALAAYLQSASSAGALLSRVAVPLMLAWAVVLFLITRVAARRAAWIGLVAITLQLTLVQEVTDGWLLLAIESVGFVAFAVALWQLSWVPRIVPALLVAFPVVDAFTPRHASVAELAAFTMFVAAGLVLAARMATDEKGLRVVEATRTCSPYRACSSGRECCAGRDARLPLRMQGPLG